LLGRWYTALQKVLDSDACAGLASIGSGPSHGPITTRDPMAARGLMTALSLCTRAA
jgi:hypothetical protein